MWFFLRVTLSVLLFWFAVAKLSDLGGLVSCLRRVAPVAIASLLFVHSATRLVQGWQLRTCLRAYLVPFSVWDVLRAQLVASFYAFLVPGELLSSGATWYYLREKHKCGSHIAVSLAFVKTINLATLLPCAVLGVALEPYLRDAGGGYKLSSLRLAYL